MSIALGNGFYSFGYYVVFGLYRAQVAQQTQAVSPHAHIQDESQRRYYSRHYVEPFALEGPCVCLDRYDRICAQMVDDGAVARVAEVFYHIFELLVYAGNGVVGLVSEEDANPVGRMFQVVML